MSRSTGFRTASAVALLLVLAAPAYAAPERIAGGTPVSAPWPAQAFLRTPLGGCGGTLVSARFVLTAAHCITNPDDGSVMSAASLSLILGRSELAGATAADTYAVATGGVTRHRAFQETDGGGLSNDLALLRLDRPAPFEPLRLVTASESALWTPGTTATVLGWGRTCWATCAPVSYLRQAAVPIVADATCGAQYAPFAGRFSAATMLCAGTGESDTCQGDSGGPLMVPRADAYALAGVTSWGEGCADPRYPGVYARLGAPALNGWVRDRIPTVAIAVTPASPDPGADVVLTASALHPGGQQPTREWDLDDDGQYDDAIGSRASLLDVAPGSHVVRVRDSYPDGDRAYAREVVTTAGSQPPQPLSTLPTPRAAAQAAPALPVESAPVAKLVQPEPRLARLLYAPLRVRLRSLLDRRLVVRARCAAECAVTARLMLDARSSRVTALTRRRGVRATVGRGRDLRASPASFKLTIRITPRGLKALRRLRRATLTLDVRARGALPGRRFKRSVAYRR